MKYWIRYTSEELFSKAISYGIAEGALVDGDLESIRKSAPGKYILATAVQTSDVLNVFDVANLTAKKIRDSGFSRPALLFNFDYYSTKDLQFLPRIRQAVKDAIIIAAARPYLIFTSLLFECGVDYIIFNQDDKHDDFEEIKKLRDAHYYKTRLIVSPKNVDDLIDKIKIHPDVICLTDKRFLELL